MQDLNTILGSVGAAEFLTLAASNYRQPCYSFQALNEDGSVLADLTPYLTSWRYTRTDEPGVSQSANFTLEFKDLSYDIYAGGANSGVLALNRPIQFRKGLVDPGTGTKYLIPGYWGRIILITPKYGVDSVTYEIVLADALKNSIKPKFTSYQYVGMQANLIATDLLQRFGQFPSNRINLAALDRTYATVQFPDMSLIDCLKQLFDPPMYMVCADEAGNIVTRPRLGSPSFGSGLLGYPDQPAAPGAGLVSYTVPQAIIETIGEKAQDYDGVYNQCRLLGQSVDTVVSLGPIELLATVLPQSVGRNQTVPVQINFSQQPTGTSSFVVGNAAIVVTFSTNHQLPNAHRYVALSNMICSGLPDAPDVAHYFGNTQAYLGQVVQWQDGFYDCVAVPAGDPSTWAFTSSIYNSPPSAPYWQKTIGPVYSSSAPYVPGMAVAWTDGYLYVCTTANDATNSQNPTQTAYWAKLVQSDGSPILGPFVNDFIVVNETDQPVGRITLKSLTASLAILTFQGFSYTEGGVGGIGARHHGGFDYLYNAYGMPILANDTSLVAYADYNVQAVVGETPSNPFADNVTYQLANQPIAPSVPVEVFFNGVSQGKVAGDMSDLSGESEFSVDWARGRVVLVNPTSETFTGDTVTTNLPAPGGLAVSTALVPNLKLIVSKAPLSVYQTARQGDPTLGQPTFTFEGLTVGQAYNIRLHLYDWVSTKAGQRKFSVYVQNEKKIEGLDLYATINATGFAWQQDITGITPDISGKIVVLVTQYDPATGFLLPECGGDGNGHGTPIGRSLINGIELIVPQGSGPNPFAVNAGGPTVATTPPAITVNYGYSPIQELYGATQLQIDDALLATQADCDTVAGFWVNRSMWRRHQQAVPVLALPFLQPGDLVKYQHKLTGTTFYLYLPQIDSSGAIGSHDLDTLNGFLLYAAN